MAGYKILWGKEKMLVTSIFSFSHNALKCFVLLGVVKVGIVWYSVHDPKKEAFERIEEI